MNSEIGVTADSALLPPHKCESCSAGLAIGSEAQQRGVVVCDDCSGLSLLVDPDTGKPLLESIGEDPRDLRFQIVESQSSVEIHQRNAGATGALLEICEGHLYIQRPFSDPLVIEAAELSQLRVKQETRPQLEARNEETNLGDLADPAADPTPEPQAQDTAFVFRVVATKGQTNEICLLDQIYDTREAFAIARALRDALLDA